MADIYHHFAALRNAEKEGESFRIISVERDSPFAVIAIHGGRIEPGTTEVAEKMAGDTHSFYSFVGLKEARNAELHITSARFDEPVCRALVARVEKAISIHGKAGAEEFVMVGGRDERLIASTVARLEEAGFATKMPEEQVNGRAAANICNLCSSGEGLQLEISRGLREELLLNPHRMEKFCLSVLEALKVGSAYELANVGVW
jgi:phage replication-related protein YjqB (UPF0714/DUF867 family)